MADNPIIRSRARDLNSVCTVKPPNALDASAVVPDRLLLTPKETAAYRRCSIRKLDRERADGGGCPYVRIDGRIFYRRADVDRFIEAHVRGGERRDQSALGHGLKLNRLVNQRNLDRAEKAKEPRSGHTRFSRRRAP